MKKRRPVARKRFGQHFLQDPTIIENIIASAGITPDDHIIEIGPGKGILTRRLLALSHRVTAIEIDRDLADLLAQEFGNQSNFELIREDILKVEWDDIISGSVKPKIVANLPYNISTPLFFKFVKYRGKLGPITIMVQKELAERLCHTGEEKLGLKDYGILSVISANTFKTTRICAVSPGCFFPRPKVESAVIRLEAKECKINNEDAFFRFVQRSFNNRRKLFLTSLRKHEPELFDCLSIETRGKLEGKRPENLKPEEFLRLYYYHEL